MPGRVSFQFVVVRIEGGRASRERGVLLGRRRHTLEGAEPTPTREIAGCAGSRDEGSVYHMIPAQCHVQFGVGQVIDNGNNRYGIAVAPPQGGSELAASVRSGVAGVNQSRNPLGTEDRRLDLTEAGDHAAGLVGKRQRLPQVGPQGVGNLIGYLGTGGWYEVCTKSAGTNWTFFWGGLAVVVSGVMVYFLTAYREMPGGKRI